MIKNYEIGQTVYLKGSAETDEVRSGVIADIQQFTVSAKPLLVKTYLLVNVPARGGAMIIPKTYRPMDLFETEEACRRQMMIDNNEVEIYEYYLQEMTSTESLLKFIFTHDMTRKADNLAYLAVTQRTEELLGINLKSLLEEREG